MNEHESLEAELAAFRPVEISPELRQRIAASLHSEPASVRTASVWNQVWLPGASVALLAACVAVLMTWRSEPPRGQTAHVNDAPVVIGTALDDSLPSLWSYRSALRENGRSLEELFEKFSQQSETTPPERARVTVFTRFETLLDDHPGDM